MQRHHAQARMTSRSSSTSSQSVASPIFPARSRNNINSSLTPNRYVTTTRRSLGRAWRHLANIRKTTNPRRWFVGTTKSTTNQTSSANLLNPFELSTPKTNSKLSSYRETNSRSVTGLASFDVQLSSSAGVSIIGRTSFGWKCCTAASVILLTLSLTCVRLSRIRRDVWRWTDRRYIAQTAKNIVSL